MSASHFHFHSCITNPFFSLPSPDPPEAKIKMKRKMVNILFILLLSFHLRLSLSSSATTGKTSSPLHFQNTKTLPAPKSPKSKSIPEDNFIVSNLNLNSKKKPTLEDKQLDKVKTSSKKTLHLNFKEEVEKLISGTGTDPKDPKPLKKKKAFVQLNNQSQTDQIQPKKPKIKLSKPDTNATTNSSKVTKSGSSTKTPIPIPKTKLKQPKNELLEETDGGDYMIPDLPDLMERLSITSKAYITAANSGIAEGVRPFLGSQFAQIVAPIASALFLFVPLLLLITLLKRLESCLSLVRHLLGFIQAYLAIYFATLAVTALVTGLEPLRFFYATSSSSYTWTQMVQSLGYVVYLVLQLVDLLAVFSCSSSSEGSRALALAQMLVGLAVGLHYYAAVFHRAVMGEPPRANWHVHGVYAMCFMLICACARAERRKKLAYVGVEGTDEWKKS